MSKVKTVFIAHPLAGDVRGNVKKILAICKKIHTKKIVPVVPYLVSVQYLNDAVVEDRKLGIDANLECFHRDFVDEVWLFGECISPGMRQEVILAKKLGIPVIAKTSGTKTDLKKMI